MESDDLKKLELKIDDLIQVVEKLRHENRELKKEHTHLSDRHTKLAEKTRIARERIEEMIGRLKALERA